MKLFREISAIQETPGGRETDEDADDEDETDDEKPKVCTVADELASTLSDDSPLKTRLLHFLENNFVKFRERAPIYL